MNCGDCGREINDNGFGALVEHESAPRVRCAGSGRKLTADAINPAHYRSHPSGVECVDIAEHYGFLIGNCFKYLWRAGLKGDAVEDLKKAKWYLEREIAKREKGRVK